MAIDTKKLEVTLTADATQFKRGMGEASADVKKFGNDVEGTSQKVEKSSKKLDESAKTAGMFGKAMGAAAAAAVVGFAALIRHQIDVADSTLKMSQRIGVSVEGLSALGFAAKRNGADVQILNAGLDGLAASAARAAGGSKLQAAAFNAIGVSVTDSYGRIKPMESLLTDVARKLATYPPGAAKVALANQLMGESGGKLLLTLDELGKDGFQSLIDKASEAGQLMSTETARQAAELNDNLDALKDTVTALANEAMAQLLPQLNAVASLMKDTETTTAGASGEVGALERIFNVVAKAGLIIKNVLDALGITIVAVGKSAWAAGVLMTQMMTAPAMATVAFAKDGMAGVKAVIAGITTSAESMKETWADAWAAFKGGWSDAGKDILAGADKLDAAMNRTAASAEKTGAAVNDVVTPITQYGKAAAAGADDTDKLANAQNRAAQFLAKLRGEAGPVSKAMEEYSRKILEANRQAAQMVALGGSVADSQRFIADATRLANAELDDQIALMRQQADVVSQAIAWIEDDRALLGLSERQRAVADAVMDAQRAYAALAPEIQALHPLTQERLDDLGREAAALYDQKQAIEFWRDTWTQAVDQVSNLVGEFAVGNIRSFKDFGRQLLDIVKQTVSKIIAEFARLAIIKMFTGQGGGWGQMASMAFSSMGGGGGGMGGSMMSSFGNLFGGGAAAASVGGTYAAGGAAPWVTGASSTAPWTTGVSSGVTGIGSGSGAAYGGSGMYGGTIGGYSTLGIGGALAGAMYGAGRGDGGLGTVGSTIAGGVGGYAIGVGAAAGMGAVAGGATLGAGAAAGLAAIPVVGWIALAALAIDAISGGKLFGTKFQTKSSTETTSISEEGANVTATLHQERQAALFGGIRRRDKDAAVSDEAREGASALRQSLIDQMASDAAAVEAEVIPIVSGIFETITTYTKKGKVKTEETISEVLGKQYKEDSEAFVQRLAAENRIALADSIGGDGLASQIAERFRDNAEALADAANYLLQAQFDLNKGQSLLTTQAGDTLSDVTEFVAGMAQQGETLLQTYQRLQQATAQYRQFIAQFDEPITVASEFQAQMYGVVASMRENIATANALAQAAGLAGAREEDLVKIHQYAARQMTALVNQLVASAANLAASLGYIHSMDSLNARIDELQGRAADAADAIGGVGSAVVSATDTMRNQIRLLLGDLSPFNDRQKLEIAREGLNAGTVSREEFLQIAQRLFGATARYVEEFNYAMSRPDGAQQDGAPGNSPGSTAQPLTQAEREELASLIEQRDAIAEAQRQQAARELAQQIADISSATGQTFEEVVAGLGFSLDQLGLDLKLDNDQLTKYLSSLQGGDLGGLFEAGLDGVASAIYEIGSAIVSAITGNETVLSPSADLQKPALLEPEGPAGQVGGSLPRNARGFIEPPPPGGGPTGGEGDVMAKSSPAQDETNARLGSLEKKLTDVLDRIANSSEATADHTNTIAAETAQSVEEIRSLRRGTEAPRARSDRPQQVVR